MTEGSVVAWLLISAFFDSTSQNFALISLISAGVGTVCIISILARALNAICGILKGLRIRINSLFDQPQVDILTIESIMQGCGEDIPNKFSA
jgi:hypothetical protein